MKTYGTIILHSGIGEYWLAYFKSEGWYASTPFKLSMGAHEVKGRIQALNPHHIITIK